MPDGHTEPVPTDEEHLRVELRRIFRSGIRLSSDCTVVQVRDVPGEVVLLVRWNRDPRLYGIPIALTDTTRDYYYTDYPVDSIEEWLDSVSLGLTIQLDTGFRTFARRTAIDDYIELRADGGWPVDNRFCHDVVEPADPYSWGRVPFVAAAGLDPTVAVSNRDAGRLIGWVTVYENNASGEPYVGQAVVSWSTETAAHLEHLEIADGVPLSVLVDLAHQAAHTAGAAGALAVTTDLDQPALAIAGFRAGPHGQRVVDTSFLDTDPSAAGRLLEATLRSNDRWGQDRDAAGRYLPGSKVGRWWHRLKHGPSGTPPRLYVG